VYGSHGGGFPPPKPEPRPQVRPEPISMSRCLSSVYFEGTGVKPLTGPISDGAPKGHGHRVSLFSLFM